MITARNLSAIGNGGYGAILINSAAIPKAITLTGFNHFKFNLGGDGLYVGTLGPITVSNITAIGNTGGSGAYLDNCLGFDVDEYCLNGIASAVTLKGVNIFSNNGWDGLRVWSPGVITANSLTANGNGTDAGRPAANVNSYYDYTAADDYDGYGKGVFLNNWGSWIPKAITLTGTNVFTGNASNGLFASTYGTVKASNITANENQCDVLYDIDTDYCAGAYLDANGITFTGNNTFIENEEIGLQTISFNSPVTLNSLYVEANGSVGVYVYANGSKPTNVSILGMNVVNGNFADGLYVIANGVVTLSNLTANSNGNSGVVVDNTSAVTPKGVSIVGTNTFNGNGLVSGGVGLRVSSYGAIVTNNVTAQFNDTGVVLDNCDYDFISVCNAYSPQAITMNGLNNLSFNDNEGLTAISQGAIKVNNLTANINGGWGAVLDNQYMDAVGAVTLTGYGNVFGNALFGLTAFSTGAVTLANLTANNNIGGMGVRIDNDFNNLKPANVTLTGINQFIGNADDGLNIYSLGAIVINNVTASDNGDPVAADGVYINNEGGLKPAVVTLNGVNTFNNNFGNGLQIHSLGSIVVNKITANDNTTAGAWLDNEVSSFTAPITFLGFAILNNNGADGLTTWSNGAITINNITANFNGNYGLNSYNYYDLLSTSSVNVTINGVNTFNGNFGDGLHVVTDGMITLNNITANDNGGFGGYLDNTANLLKNIVINGTNNFVSNSTSGLYFNASGAVTITRITADENDDEVGGAPTADGIEGIAAGSITLTCGSLTNNEGNGYNLTSTGGTITLKGIFTFGNLGNNSNVAPVISRTCPLP
jgi:hypothetical protein